MVACFSGSTRGFSNGDNSAVRILLLCNMMDIIGSQDDDHSKLLKRREMNAIVLTLNSSVVAGAIKVWEVATHPFAVDLTREVYSTINV